MLKIGDNLILMKRGLNSEEHSIAGHASIFGYKKDKALEPQYFQIALGSVGIIEKFQEYYNIIGVTLYFKQYEMLAFFSDINMCIDEGFFNIKPINYNQYWAKLNEA